MDYYQEGSDYYNYVDDDSNILGVIDRIGVLELKYIEIVERVLHSLAPRIHSVCSNVIPNNYLPHRYLMDLYYPIHVSTTVYQLENVLKACYNVPDERLYTLRTYLFKFYKDLNEAICRALSESAIMATMSGMYIQFIGNERSPDYKIQITYPVIDLSVGYQLLTINTDNDLREAIGLICSADIDCRIYPNMSVYLWWLLNRTFRPSILDTYYLNAESEGGPPSDIMDLIKNDYHEDLSNVFDKDEFGFICDEFIYFCYILSIKVNEQLGGIYRYTRRQDPCVRFIIGDEVCHVLIAQGW